jgi:hypothetical protein
MISDMVRSLRFRFGTVGDAAQNTTHPGPASMIQGASRIYFPPFFRLAAGVPFGLAADGLAVGRARFFATGSAGPAGGADTSLGLFPFRSSRKYSTSKSSASGI